MKKAFERYLARDFASAIDILIKTATQIRRAQCLIRRCRDYLREPPPTRLEWNICRRSPK